MRRGRHEKIKHQPLMRSARHRSLKKNRLGAKMTPAAFLPLWDLDISIPSSDRCLGTMEQVWNRCVLAMCSRTSPRKDSRWHTVLDPFLPIFSLQNRVYKDCQLMWDGRTDEPVHLLTRKENLTKEENRNRWPSPFKTHFWWSTRNITMMKASFIKRRFSSSP